MPTWTENDIIANGIKIHYLRTGRGDKPALVLSHGFSGSGWGWFETAQALEADFDLVLPDMRGHGRSHRCEQGEKTDLTGDLAGLILALHLQKPIVGGHSLGANYAARLAACHPELLSGLILVDPAWCILPPGVPDEPRPPSDDDAPPGESTYDRWLVRMMSLPVEETIAALRAQSPEKDAASLRRWAETLHGFDPHFFTTEDIAQIDFPELTTMITCPTLLVTGEAQRGAIVGAQQARWIVEKNPLFDVVKISGAGHNIMADNFSDYIQAIRAFLARFRGRGTAIP
jgi:pimeloyl-ACP methyl ester carboxylesterase